MRDQAGLTSTREEADEVEELRRLLERTNHEFAANGARCGDVSTTTLRRLPDGQNESSVELFFKRKAEAERAQQISGMPAWDSTPYREAEAPKPEHVPMRQLVEEKLTFEQRVYEPLMKAKREAKRNGEGEGTASQPKAIKPAHAEMIEQMMRAYRHEQGAPKVRRTPRPSDQVVAHCPESVSDTLRRDADPFLSPSAPGRVYFLRLSR